MPTLALLAALPDGLDSDVLQKVIIALLVLCGLGVILVLRTVQKLTTRLLAILLLVAAGAALWIQRENLDDCRSQCTCRLFGQDVRVPDIANLNPQCLRT
ncbi:MAG: hypothetical protein H0W25_15760 [Acidimicrobiia bacterium]|nr:hypothetical protein [Acidimicrobiia bacterium]